MYYYSNGRGSVALCFICKIISRIKPNCGLQEPGDVKRGEVCSNKGTLMGRDGGQRKRNQLYLLLELLPWCRLLKQQYLNKVWCLGSSGVGTKGFSRRCWIASWWGSASGEFSDGTRVEWVRCGHEMEAPRCPSGPPWAGTRHQEGFWARVALWWIIQAMKDVAEGTGPGTCTQGLLLAAGHPPKVNGEVFGKPQGYWQFIWNCFRFSLRMTERRCFKESQLFCRAEFHFSFWHNSGAPMATWSKDTHKRVSTAPVQLRGAVWGVRGH